MIPNESSSKIEIPTLRTLTFFMVDKVREFHRRIEITVNQYFERRVFR